MLSFIFSKTPLSFFVQSFWRDEAFSYLLAKKNIVEIIFLTAKDYNPPLYYLILHFWMKFFGHSEIALRSLSLIFYWATIYIVFLFLTEIFKIKNKLLLLLSLIFFIANPVLIYYAFEARMYTLLAFFSVLSSYAFLKENKKIYFFATTFGLLTHYYMIFVFLSHLITYFINKKKLKTTNLIFFIQPLVYFLIWITFVFFQNHQFLNNDFWIKKQEIKDLKNFAAILFTGYEKDFDFNYEKITQFSVFLSLIIIIIFLTKKRNLLGKKVVFFYLFLSGLFIPFIIFIVSLFKPIFLPRYLIGQTMLFLLFIIYLLNKIDKKIVSFFILLIFLYFSFDYQKLQIKYRKKSDYKKLYKEIKSLLKKDDLVYVTSELDFFVAQYYVDENRVKIYGKTDEEIPNYVGKVLIPKKAIVYNLPFYPKKAFIVNNDSYSIQSSF